MAPAEETPSVSPAPEEVPFELPEGDPIELPAWLPNLLRGLAMGAVVLAIVWFLVRLWRARVRLRRVTAVAPTGEAVEVVDLDEEQFADTVAETVERLRGGMAVQGAVVECWRRLEALAADTGIRRHLAQTAHEFTLEVLSRTTADPHAISQLADLYRQAMFSTHALTEADREHAVAALEELSGQLRGAS